MKAKNIFIGLVVGLAMGFVAPSQALATPACDITMSGVSLTPNSNPTVKPTQKKGTTSVFSFKACIINSAIKSQLASCLQTGSKVQLSVKETIFSTDKFELSGTSNCFSGSLELEDGDAHSFNKMNVVTTGGGCPSNTELCAQVSADLDRSSTTDNQEECEAAKNNFCNSLSINPSEIVVDKPLNFSFYVNPLLNNLDKCGNEFNDIKYLIIPPEGDTISGSLNTGSNTFTYAPIFLTDYKLKINASEGVYQPGRELLSCEYSFSVGTEENPGSLNTSPINDEPWALCEQIPESSDGRSKCETCLDKEGIWTAIGCIPTDSTDGIVGELMSIGLSIAGGIALLMILAAAFLFATSEGEPKRTGEAKEILTSAIVGLIFIIFSVTILEFIGVNILQIPGFGGS